MTKCKQVEFLLMGSIPPPTIGRLQVSETLIIEQGFGYSDPTGQEKPIALGYVGVGDISNPFRIAIPYMDFFLLIYALTTSQPVIHFVGVATEIPNLTALATHRVTFPSVEKVTFLNEDLESDFSKPILLAKKRFLELEKHRETIMDGYLGLALRYWLFATQANERGHFDEVVIHLSIAAEAMFSSGTDFKSNLKRRLSTFIGENESERINIAKKVGELYDLRGAVVHGGKKKIPLADVRLASSYIRRAIEKALSTKHFSKHDLVTMLEQMA